MQHHREVECYVPYSLTTQLNFNSILMQHSNCSLLLLIYTYMHTYMTMIVFAIHYPAYLLAQVGKYWQERVLIIWWYSSIPPIARFAFEIIKTKLFTFQILFVKIPNLFSWFFPEIRDSRDRIENENSDVLNNSLWSPNPWTIYWQWVPLGNTPNRKASGQGYSFGLDPYKYFSIESVNYPFKYLNILGSHS